MTKIQGDLTTLLPNHDSLVTPIFPDSGRNNRRRYIIRLWSVSIVIIRIPSDPLQPDRQIWTYYTHMADIQGNSFISSDFPPGTSEVFVDAGTLLGYQGDFSGSPGNPTGIHLHFSIVLDDGQGNYLNELEIGNTLDPSPYLGLDLNANTNPNEIPLCPVN